MATDPSIILGIQQPDFGKIVAEAAELRKIKEDQRRENTLKYLATQPGSIDQKTGMPTANMLSRYAKVDPMGAAKLSAEVGQAQEREAQTAHLNSEVQTADQGRHREALRDAIDVYTASVSDGHTAPAIAERDLKNSVKDYVDSNPAWSDADKARIWGQLSEMNPAQLRGLLSRMDMTAAERNAEEKDTREVTPFIDSKGNTLFIAKGTDEQGKPIIKDAEGNRVTPEGALEHPASEMDTTRAGLAERAQALREKVAAGGAADLTEDDKKFAAQLVLDGQPMPNMGYGAAGAAARKEILHMAAEMAAAQEGSPEAGAARAVERKEELRADQASLTAVTKQQQSVRQFSGAALQLTDKVEGLASKGTTERGPEFLAGLMQKIKTKAFGDPDVREFLGYITDLESENAKIMAGATGSVAQVSAHNQELMNQIIRGDMPASELRGALKTIREGIKIRNNSIDEEVKRQREQLARDTSGGSSAPKISLPRDLPSAEGLANGSKAKDKNGKVVAVIKDGAWVAP